MPNKNYPTWERFTCYGKYCCFWLVFLTVSRIAFDFTTQAKLAKNVIKLDAISFEPCVSLACCWCDRIWQSFSSLLQGYWSQRFPKAIWLVGAFIQLVLVVLTFLFFDKFVHSVGIWSFCGWFLISIFCFDFPLLSRMRFSLWSSSPISVHVGSVHSVDEFLNNPMQNSDKFYHIQSSVIH